MKRRDDLSIYIINNRLHRFVRELTFGGERDDELVRRLEPHEKSGKLVLKEAGLVRVQVIASHERFGEYPALAVRKELSYRRRQIAEDDRNIGIRFWSGRDRRLVHTKFLYILLFRLFISAPAPASAACERLA